MHPDAHADDVRKVTYSSFSSPQASIAKNRHNNKLIYSDETSFQICFFQTSTSLIFCLPTNINQLRIFLTRFMLFIHSFIHSFLFLITIKQFTQKFINIKQDQEKKEMSDVKICIRYLESAGTKRQKVWPQTLIR